jgi:hypothetical protein
MRYTMMEPNIKPVRNMTALKQRYPETIKRK